MSFDWISFFLGAATVITFGFAGLVVAAMKAYKKMNESKNS